MAEEKQSYSNHVRWDPGFHFFLFPVAAITAVMVIRRALASPVYNFTSLWPIAVAVAGLYLVFKVRLYSLKAQDRVIRLEERLRLMNVLPAAQHARIIELRPRQLVALRFASDAELPALAERCWTENLEPKQIKEAIKDWRGDFFRI
jgi:hypothetical protein